MSENGQGWFLMEKLLHYVVMLGTVFLIGFALWYAYMLSRPAEKITTDVIVEGGGDVKPLPEFMGEVEALEQEAVTKMPEIKYDGQKELPDFLKKNNEFNEVEDVK